MFITKTLVLMKKPPFTLRAKHNPQLKCALFTYLMLKHATPNVINVVRTLYNSYV